MSGFATEFARDAPGVTAAEDVREGEYVHVYEGHLAGTEESVRFVTLAPEIEAADAVESFRRAAGAWQNANTHPNIVSVYDLDDEPQPWIAVSDITGQPLDAVQPSLSPDETKRIITDVAEALRNASLYNTSHLDLRPDRVWVVPDGEGVTGLVDEWGLERAVRTAVGSFTVTPYTAPEVVADPTSANEQTDIYGLGAITYFALTGQPPITTSGDLSAAITEGSITPPAR